MIDFIADGNYCLTCGSDKSIKLWNPEKNVLIKKYTGHGYDVLDVAGSCDNSQLASCGSDKTVIYWDVGTGQVRIYNKFVLYTMLTAWSSG